MRLNLSLFIEDDLWYDDTCPVCKGKITEEGACYGFRIREIERNIMLYGWDVIYHPKNRSLVCGPVCSERISRSWESESAEDKRKAFIAEMKEEQKQFQASTAKAMQGAYSGGKPKRKRY